MILDKNVIMFHVKHRAAFHKIEFYITIKME